MAVPPFEDGAVHVMVATPLPGVALTLVGAPATVTGVTAADGADGALVPAAFVAVTVKV